MTCLHQSCINGNIDLVRLLIECGSQIDIEDNNGFRPLHYACQNAKYDIASVLIRYGVDCNQCTLINNETPLHIAIQNNALYNTNTNPNENASIGEKLVYLLLSNGGYLSLALLNKQKQTPFELACELGRFNVVDIILKFCLNNSEIVLNNLNFSDINNALNEKLLIKSSMLMGQYPKLMQIIYLYSENSLHFASRNGHDNIIRLLLQFGVVDINKLSELYHGNALHEACRYGRYQTVKLLLECGIDSNAINNFNQKPIDVVIKQKIGNEIKQLIREFSQVVHAVTIQPYMSNHAGSLNFELNEIVTILERPTTSPNWRGFILNRANFSTRSGYFPSTHVKIININDIQNKALNTQSNNNNIYNKSNYGTLKLSKSLAKPFITSSTTSLLINNNSNSNEIYNSSVQFKFDDDYADNISIIDKNLSINKLNTSNTSANNNMKQNKDSIYIGNMQLDRIQKQQQQMNGTINSLMSFSNQNNGNIYSIAGGFSPSSSSSSTASSNAMPSNTSSPSHKSISKPLMNIGDLLRSGLTDSQIIFNWLSEMNLQQYYENFVQAGYDLITIMKTTPADLSAIGISDPSHRNLIKQQMQRINIDELDNKLNFVLSNVNTIDDLLKLIHLEQYFDSITQLGNFKSLHEMLNALTWEDLEEIGIKKLGHQKKLMLVVKRMKEILKNKNQDLKSPVTQNTKVGPITINSSNWLAKSLENINDTINSLNISGSSKPVPPKRFDSTKCSHDFVMSSFNSDKTQSALSTPQKTVSSYATLPRNRKPQQQQPQLKKLEGIKAIDLGRPGSSSSHTSTTSSGLSPTSASPTSISSSHSDKGDFDSMFVPPPPPPPMPLIPDPISSSYHAISRRIIEMPKQNPEELIKKSYCINSNILHSKNNRSLIQSNSPIKNNFSNTNSLVLNKNDVYQIYDNKLTTKDNSIQSLKRQQPVLNMNNSNDNNVLNDIDSMLCDLNKQLDDMLDYDKVFKN